MPARVPGALPRTFAVTPRFGGVTLTRRLGGLGFLRLTAQLVERGFDKAVVTRIEHLLYIAEYKRRQAPPGVKIGRRNFGRDRRYPISNAFRTG